MNLSQLLTILNVRRYIILIVAIITAVTATTVSMLLPKNYYATSSVLLNYKGVDPVTGISLPAQLLPGYMGTQAEIIQSKNVAIDVVNRLKLTEIPSIKQDFAKASEKNQSLDITFWLADKLANNLDVKPSRESSVINISYKGVEPTFVATMANAFAESYIAISLKLKIDPAIKASEYLSEQNNVLRDNLQKAQEKLSKYQQERGFTSIQDTFDVESSKLRDLSSQYSLMQSQANDSSSRRSSAVNNMSESPDVATNPVVQNLRISLVTAEAKLSELAEKFSKNHPSYIASEAEVIKLRSQLQTEIDRAVKSLSNNANIDSQRFADVKAQLEKQKQKVLALNRSRSELMIYEKEVQIAQNALESVNNRFSQTVLEGRSNQADIAILERATPPQSPSNPRVILVLPFSLIVGGILGCFFALLAEFIDRRVRSRDDILAIVDIPVYVYSIK